MFVNKKNKISKLLLKLKRENQRFAKASIPLNLFSTKRFQFALRLFSNRSQITLKCCKNKLVRQSDRAECNVYFSTDTYQSHRLLVSKSVQFPLSHKKVTYLNNRQRRQLSILLWCSVSLLNCSLISKRVGFIVMSASETRYYRSSLRFMPYDNLVFVKTNRMMRLTFSILEITGKKVRYVTNKWKRKDRNKN